MDSLLITLADIKTYRPTADLVSARVDTYIREAQMDDLKPFLGLPLYHDLQANPLTTLNSQLINGGITYQDIESGYQIEFNGLKPILVYYALARIASNAQINITSYGLVTKNIQQSELATDQSVKRLITELRSIAIAYQDEASKYLTQKLASYPLWNFNKKGPNNSKGINFFKL